MLNCAMYNSAGQPIITQFSPPQHYPPIQQSTSSQYWNYQSFLPERPRAERRRPKYTRSKTGCLTCRRKKVKCDETKEICQRCQNSQLVCTWPEVTPVKKRPSTRKKAATEEFDSHVDELGYQHSTAAESEVSDIHEASDVVGLPLAGGSHASETIAGRRHSASQIEPPLLPPIQEKLNISSESDISDKYGRGLLPDYPCGSALGLNISEVDAPTSSITSAPSLHVQNNSRPYSPSSGNVGYSQAPTSNAGAMSRPSSASSFSLASSLTRRTSLSSRPSTAGSYSPSNQYLRPSPRSSFGGSDSFSIGPQASPSPYALAAAMVFEKRNDTLAPYNGTQPPTYSSSRPSTANSAASTSPYVRHVADLTSTRPTEQWYTSPQISTTGLSNTISYSRREQFYAPNNDISVNGVPYQSRSNSPWP